MDADIPPGMHHVTIAPTFQSWRMTARTLLRREVPPGAVTWHESSQLQGDLLWQQTHEQSDDNAQLTSGQNATPQPVECSSDASCMKRRDQQIARDANCVERAGTESARLVVASGEPIGNERVLSNVIRAPRAFLDMAESVACHSDCGRWNALYRVLYRLTHGEPSLLEVATDPDVHCLLAMNKAVRRAVHKMHAFVRFRAVETRTENDGRIQYQTTYVAWFEPLHHVVQRAIPLFTRRFASMRWSVLTPLECAHWDGEAVHFTPGVSRAMAPAEDELEELWRSYYAHIFNPARVSVATMQAEMPRQYWANLPEARLIGTLTREAPSRVARMLAQIEQPPDEIPAELQSRVGVVTIPERSPLSVSGFSSATASAELVDLDAAGAWDAVHDPGVRAAQQRALCAENSDEDSRHTTTFHSIRSDSCSTVAKNSTSLEIQGVPVRLGTASWTDPTLLRPGVFYPESANTPESRLQYYASRFSLVEVDSTYYVPPTRSMAAAWASRTPDNFVFDIKAFALMTGHAADIKRLPDWLRRLLPKSLRGAERVYAKDLRTADIDEVWTRFTNALEPLCACHKLGPILLQFPRWFEPSRESADALRAARERLGNLAAAVEFRNPAWVTGRLAARTFALLEKLQLSYVVVDAPPGTTSSMPLVAHVTTPGLAVVRLHGRRVATWERRNAIVSERYRYLYDAAELNEWTHRIGALAEGLRSGFPDMAKARQGVHVVFNNCHANYGTTNTDEITALLRKFDRQRQMI